MCIHEANPELAGSAKAALIAITSCAYRIAFECNEPERVKAAIVLVGSKHLLRL